MEAEQLRKAEAEAQRVAVEAVAHAADAAARETALQNASGSKAEQKPARVMRPAKRRSETLGWPAQSDNAEGGVLWPSGPVGVRRNFDQCSDQPQERLVFRPLRLGAEKRSQIDVREAATRRPVWLMNYERTAVLWLSP